MSAPCGNLNDEFLATREAAELRAASVQLGYSLRLLLAQLPDFPARILQALQSIEEPALALRLVRPRRPRGRFRPAIRCSAYLWSWAENQVLVAVKSLPLGQSAGQRVLQAVGASVESVSAAAAALRAVAPDGGPGAVNFAPALAILSSQHETQYSRLFRS